MIIVGLSDRITPWALQNMMPTLRAVDWKAPPIVAMEIEGEYADHIHLGQPERMGLGKGRAEDACLEDGDARQVGDMCGGDRCPS